jgi:hypothetical protein
VVNRVLLDPLDLPHPDRIVDMGGICDGCVP